MAAEANTIPSLEKKLLSLCCSYRRSHVACNSAGHENRRRCWERQWQECCPEVCGRRRKEGRGEVGEPGQEAVEQSQG